MVTIIFRILAVIILPIFLLGGCEESTTNDNTIHGSGKIVTELRTVEECSGISIMNIGNIYLTQDTIQSIRIEADDNIINDVKSIRENGILKVGLDEGSYSDITLNIYASLKTIGSLSINGAGQIISQNNFNCTDLTCFINGAGNAIIKGSGSYFNCSINGAGNINAQEFISERCKAVVNGAGNCLVYASEEIDATLNGAGSIIYYGNPANVKTSISGLGQITGR